MRLAGIMRRENIPNKGVDLDGVNIVKLLESDLDLGLVCLDVDDEDEGVVLLNLLHGGLGVQWVDNDLVLIETWGVWDGLAWVLWGAGQDQGLWAVEGGRVADLASLVGVGLKRFCQLEFPVYCDSSRTYTLEGSLRGIVGLLVTLAGLRGTTCCYASAIALERTRNSCCCCAYVYPPLQRPSDPCLCCAKL